MGPPDDYGDDPNAPQPTNQEIKTAVRHWLFWTGALSALALLLVVWEQAAGKVKFF